MTEKDHLDELLNNVREKSMWQDIETAPKDGTVVLLYGLWCGEINGPDDHWAVDIGHWSDGTSDYPGNDWWSLDTGDAYACWMSPTHWQPLPTPPKP